MKEPTKADLAAAVAKLTEENAGLRDMLAAVSECARSVPQAAGRESYFKELHRATNVLGTIKVVTDPGRSWTWGWATGAAARYLRECAAEPPGYEVYVKPEPAQAESDEAEPEPGTQAYADKYSSRTVQRELFAETPQDQPASPDAAEALAGAIVAGTPVKAADDEPACCGSERKLSGGPLYQCELPLGHEGLHSVLTPTGAFIAEWSNDPSAGVHTPSGYQPAGVPA